jgi:DNA recombination protein RmuC
MEIILLIIFLIILIAGFTGIFWLMYKKQRKPEDQSLIILQNQINEMNRQIEQKMEKVSEHLIKIGETNRQVVSFTEQLQNLQDILKNPKQRGIVGEYFLETVLGNVLPENSYQMQYTFKNGDIVDAVIFTKDRIVPVDSKFSLENYNRLIQTNDEDKRKKLAKEVREDLKKRIDETAKYIKPEENTTEFAFMFIPSEALYYDLLIHKVGSIDKRDLIEYATGKKKVIIVSPTSFLAYLQTVLQGMREFRIEESAKEIKKWVQDLGRHLKVFKNNIEKLRQHLATAVRSFNSASGEFKKIDKDIDRITGEGINVEVKELDLPEDDE